MSPLKRSTSRQAKARKAVRKSAKSTKRKVERKGALWIVTRFVPRRALVAIGGAGAAAIAFLTLKRRKDASSPPSYTPPTPTGPPATGS